MIPREIVEMGDSVRNFISDITIKTEDSFEYVSPIFNDFNSDIIYNTKINEDSSNYNLNTGSLPVYTELYKCTLLDGVTCTNS